MPTYEYQCDKCGQNFELFQKFTDKALRRHPECGGKVEKVFHPRGVVFKGSGFYVNDSRSKQESNGEKSKTKESKDTKESGASSVATDKAAVSSSDSNSD